MGGGGGSQLRRGRSPCHREHPSSFPHCACRSPPWQHPLVDVGHEGKGWGWGGEGGVSACRINPLPPRCCRHRVPAPSLHHPWPRAGVGGQVTHTHTPPPGNRCSGCGVESPPLLEAPVLPEPGVGPSTAPLPPHHRPVCVSPPPPPSPPGRSPAAVPALPVPSPPGRDRRKEPGG